MSEREQLDPIRIWREWIVKSEKQWSDHLTDLMGDERFSKGMGRYMQEGLHTQRMFGDAMAQSLSSLNMPSRTDILDIGDRLGQMEETLSGLQVEIREQRAQLTRLASTGSADPAPKKAPSRTKKPPVNSDK
jgi:hypothetical protein